VMKDAGPEPPSNVDRVVERTGVQDDDLVHDTANRAQAVRKDALFVPDDQDGRK
jgi:hypothetical protein